MDRNQKATASPIRMPVESPKSRANRTRGMEEEPQWLGQPIPHQFVEIPSLTNSRVDPRTDVVLMPA